MDRREFFAKSGVAAAGIGIVGGAGTASAGAPKASLADLPDLEWEMPTSWPLALDTIYGGAEVFAEEVGRLTAGKFVITARAGGEVVPGLEVLQNVQSGAYPIGHTASYYYIGLAQWTAFGTAMPFGLTARQQNAWLYEGGGLTMLQELYDQHVRGHPVPRRQHRLPDGRLVPQRDHVRRRSRRAEDAHPRPRWRGDGPPRRRRPADRRGRDLPGPADRRDRRRRVGRPVRRPQPRLRRDRPELLLPRVVGGGADARGADQQGRVGRSARALPERHPGGGVQGQHDHDGPLRQAERRVARPARGGRRDDPSVSRGHHERGPRGGVRALRRVGERRRELRHRVRVVERLPRGRRPLVRLGRGEHHQLLRCFRRLWRRRRHRPPAAEHRTADDWLVTPAR